MAKILICLEDFGAILPDVQKTAYVHYSEEIEPHFLQAGLDFECVSCAEVWSVLINNAYEAVLLFPESMYSCCWQIAYRIRNEWPVGTYPPLIFMHCYWNQDLYVPTYYFEFTDYYWLFDHYADGSRWSGESLSKWISLRLGRNTFDPQVFEEQLEVILSTSQENYTWEKVADLAYHHLIQVTLHTPEPEQFFTILWLRSQRIYVVDGWDIYKELVEASGMRIAYHLRDMLTILASFQQKDILYKVRGPDEEISPYSYLLDELSWSGKPTYGLLAPPSKHPLLSQYKDVNFGPKFWANGREQQARFWMIEKKTGNLEEWLFIQTAGRLTAQSWLREEGFALDIENCLVHSRIPDILPMQIEQSTTLLVSSSDKSDGLSET